MLSFQSKVSIQDSTRPPLVPAPAARITRPCPWFVAWFTYRTRALWGVPMPVRRMSRASPLPYTGAASSACCMSHGLLLSRHSGEYYQPVVFKRDSRERAAWNTEATGQFLDRGLGGLSNLESAGFPVVAVEAIKASLIGSVFQMSTLAGSTSSLLGISRQGDWRSIDTASAHRCCVAVCVLMLLDPPSALAAAVTSFDQAKQVVDLIADPRADQTSLFEFVARYQSAYMGDQPSWDNALSQWIPLSVLRGATLRFDPGIRLMQAGRKTDGTLRGLVELLPDLDSQLLQQTGFYTAIALGVLPAHFRATRASMLRNFAKSSVDDIRAFCAEAGTVLNRDGRTPI